MEPTTDDVLISNSPTRRRVWKWAAIIAGAATITAVAVLAASGVIYAGVKAPAQRVAVQTVVCGDEIIDRYNQLSLSVPLNPAAQQNLSRIVKDITAKGDYAKDPTCQAILWWNAMQSRDAAEMKKALNSLKNLRNDGLYVDNNLMNTFSIPSMNSLTEEASGGSLGGDETN